MHLSHSQIQQFKIDGYLILKSVVDAQAISTLRNIVDQHLEHRIPPLELEVEVQYPGSPTSETAVGGQTIRRLKDAYWRHEAFKDLACSPTITHAVKSILSCGDVVMNPNHHNCIMTKLPRYSSKTLWHRDTRYWNFSDKYLINAWIALGDELERNGAMQILPGSHRWEVSEDALDQAQFLILDHADNIDRLETRRTVELNMGDILLFSAHCFHAAGRNRTDAAKYSAVFTYHGEQTSPIKGTHSASRAEITVL